MYVRNEVGSERRSVPHASSIFLCDCMVHAKLACIVHAESHGFDGHISTREGACAVKASVGWPNL